MADDVLTPEEMGDVLTPEEMGGAAPSHVPGLDVAPAARPSRYPQPKSMTASDAELGIASPPISRGLRPVMEFGPNHQPVFPPPEAYSADGRLQGKWNLRTPDPMEVDPIAQAVVASTVLGPLGRVASGALPRVLAPAVAAAEGGAASKMMGGDLAPGMALGALFGTAGALARTASPAAAVARTEARLAKDVTAGLPRSGRAVNDVKFKAGEGNADLAQVADELPEVGKALKTQARTNPKAAHKVTAATVDDLTDANDADFAAIQRQHGGVPLQPIAEKLAGLEERLNQQGHGVSADAVARVRTDLLKRYAGDPGVGLADVKLTAQQVRNIRNDMGTVADPARNIKPNTRRQALGKIYGILNKEIEDVAADTRGVDVNKLRARNRQISTLIPVRDALAARADKLADTEIGIVGLAKKLPEKVAKRFGREVDYRLSRVPIGGELAPGRLPVAVPVSAARFGEDRDFARKVTDGMGSGLSLQDAVSAAGGE